MVAVVVVAVIAVAAAVAAAARAVPYLLFQALVLPTLRLVHTIQSVRAVLLPVHLLLQLARAVDPRRRTVVRLALLLLQLRLDVEQTRPGGERRARRW